MKLVDVDSYSFQNLKLVNYSTYLHLGTGTGDENTELSLAQYGFSIRSSIGVKPKFIIKILSCLILLFCL